MHSIILSNLYNTHNLQTGEDRRLHDFFSLSGFPSSFIIRSMMGLYKLFDVLRRVCAHVCEVLSVQLVSFSDLSFSAAAPVIGCRGRERGTMH